MYGIRRDTNDYLTALQEFINCAKEDMKRRGDWTILCPCRDCENLRRFRDIEEVRGHLIRRGFKERYTQWIWHGESSEESVHVGPSRNVSESETFLESTTDVQDEMDGENRENLDSTQCIEHNELDEMMHDVEAEFIDIPEIFENLCNESNIPLFPGCRKFTKISAVFKLFNLKAKNGWSDQSFTYLLELLRDMLPENNELPDSTYKAKKLLCPLSMEVKRIHACPNDCILYRNEYNDLDKCPKCEVSRYKSADDQINNRKRPAAKVLWYLPVVPRFRRLFVNPRDAKLLRWHVDCRKEDGMLRHPADSPEWRKIDKRFPDFGAEPRNLRLGLCTDGMNPYGNMSSRYST